jgi:hypothetical protein
MELDFRPLKQPHAVAILDWHYPAPYDVYNFKPAQRQTDLDSLLNPQNNFSVSLTRMVTSKVFAPLVPMVRCRVGTTVSQL